MPIPNYQQFMLPVLKYCGDQKEHSMQETYEHIAKELGLTDADRKEMVPSGQQTVFENRVSWARTYLKKAELLVYPKRGTVRITDRGLDVLSQKPKEISKQFLMQFPEFMDFQSKKDTKPSEVDDEVKEKTPLELLDIGYQQIRNNLISDILEQLKKVTPTRFEQIVVELVVKMGYGGSLKDAGQAIGKSGDGGIDGIIKEDRLGLDTIYIQAKRWEENISRPELQKFFGALQMRHAKKGIFITTSNFSKEALDSIKFIDTKVVLMDGDTLAQYMIEFNVGVSTVSSYEIKKIDTDYFTEE